MKKENNLEINHSDSLIKKKNRDLKIIIVGDRGSGKTCFVNRYILRKFSSTYQATIGSAFSYKILKKDNIIYRLQFWDIAGQDSSPDVTKIFCKNAQGIVFCCEVNNQKSIDSLLKWKDSLNQHINLEKIPMIIIENKCDLLGKNEEDYNKDIEELKNFAEENNIKKAFRTSAVTGYGIDEAMDYLIKEIIEEFNLNNIIMNESIRETIALTNKSNKAIRGRNDGCC